ncbi:MAG: hypothetical protein AAGC46_01300 [Solirubrobacteraceae bacterium]|nr:hypothetical protein [Patulibacter sp.]
MQVTTQARPRAAIASAAGTCGELAQGVLPGGQRFHVTCPIDRGSRVSVRTAPASRTTIAGLSPAMWKARRALALAVELLELSPQRIVVEHASDLPAARGLASSTADVVATVRALAAAHDVELDALTLARLAASIEPTDGVMFDGLAVVDQLTGARLRRWAWWPQFHIAMFVPREQRETGRSGAPTDPRHATEYADLLDCLDRAVGARDAEAFAAQATRSSLLNDVATPNRLLAELLPALDLVGGAGLCVGHSGTVCGVLFAGAHASEAAGQAVGDLLPALPHGTIADVVATPASPTP